MEYAWYVFAGVFVTGLPNNMVKNHIKEYLVGVFSCLDAFILMVVVSSESHKRLDVI